MTPETSTDDRPTDAVLDRSRLMEIGSYDVMSAPVRSALDELARTAAERLGSPIGMVTIVMDSAQFLAGTHGVQGWMAEAGGTPVEWSFCANVVRSGEPYVVEDASTDPVQRHNPLVTLDGLRHYAGAPVVTASGSVLGAMCVAGGTPRRFTSGEVAVLVELAAAAAAEIARFPYRRS